MRARFSILILFSALCGWAHAAEIARAPMPVLMPPIPPSPIEQFRQWLRMPVADREKSLGEYSEAKQIVLRQKLQDYAAMPLDQRERQLRMLELRWYLRPLMSTAPEQRGDYLDLIPVRLHESLSARLQKWDGLAAETRREILATEDSREMATRYFVQLRRSAVTAQDLHPLDEKQRAVLQESLRRWNETSSSHRERLSEHLSTFFDLTRPDQERTLGQLSETDRSEMQKTLETFARLSPEQRRACVDSFQKFATMTPIERATFLRNATRWQQMTAQEREIWKRLVHKLPPMPPEPLMIPPLPQAALPLGKKMARTIAR